MKIEKINKILKQKYPNVKAEIKDACILLTGECDNWADIVQIGYLAVDKKRYVGVLNDIKLKGVSEKPMRIPNLTDKSLDGTEVDFLVVGGGISGASILRELTRYNASAMLVEKESDLAMQASGRNDGEVHPGVDLSKGSKKNDYVLKANKIFGDVCDELGVDFIRRGQYACFNMPIKPILSIFASFKSHNNCPTEVASNKEIKEKEPFYNKDIKCALSNQQAGVVSPYELTIAFAENAVSNGARVELNTAVIGINLKNDNIISVETNRGTIYPKVLINAAGCFSDKIAEMANDRFFTIHPRCGSDYIFDNKISYKNNHISSIMLYKSNKAKKKGKSGHTKGGGIVKTIDNNILIGPNAYETYEREDFSTNADSLNQVFDKQKYVLPSLEKKDIIAYFTGTRAATYEEDFYIEKGKKTKNIVHCAGIQSPGLTTSPVVAKDVARMAVEILSETKKVEINDKFNPKRDKPIRLRNLNDKERTELIKTNPSYGKIVCRCEEISEGEIIDSLNRNIKVATVNGIKRRVRPGMGRCQGGFCMPLVAKIIAEHEGIPLTEVKGKQMDAPIVYNSSKGGNSHE